MKYIHNDIIHNTKAAKEIVPILIEIFKPKSIIDIGCGTGSWLKIFEEHGVENALGIDGEHLDEDKMVILPSKIQKIDLERKLILDRKYDLLLCLEVAEHLSIERATSFISELTKISDTIIFSAALPFQGGQNHINEQFIDYWVNLFYLNGFIAEDSLRPIFWNNQNIDWWYRQNMLVFKRKEGQIFYPNALISKELYEIKINEINALASRIRNIEIGGRKVSYYLLSILRKIKRKLL